MIEKGTGTIVITGGSSGIGAGFAKAFAQQGYTLVLVAHNESEMTTFVQELRAIFPVEVTSMIIDLSKKEGAQRLEETIARLTDLAGLVNCAGYGIHKDFVQEDIDKREDMVNVHDIATMRLCHQALAVMEKNNRGIIINIASLTGFFPIGNSPVYTASKMFLHTFSANLYWMYKKRGIYIQSLCPGFTSTNFYRRAGNEKPTQGIMTVDQVIKQSMSALRHKRPVCIPGRKNRLFLGIYRMVPKSRSRRLFVQFLR